MNNGDLKTLGEDSTRWKNMECEKVGRQRGWVNIRFHERHKKSGIF